MINKYLNKVNSLKIGSLKAYMQKYKLARKRLKISQKEIGHQPNVSKLEYEYIGSPKLIANYFRVIDTYAMGNSFKWRPFVK